MRSGGSFPSRYRFMASLVFSLLLSLFFGGPASGELTVTYKGPTVTHLTYSHLAGDEGDLGVKLVVVLSDASEIQLAPVNEPYGPLSFSEPHH